MASLLAKASVLAVIALCFQAYWQLSSERPVPGIPILSSPPLSPKQSWIRQGSALLARGFQEYSSKQQHFQVITGTGPKIVLPNSFAEEIKNIPTLSFAGAVALDFFPEYPGFEGPRTSLHELSDTVLQDTVRTNLTQSLGLIMEDSVEETEDSVRDVFGDEEEWKTMRIKDGILEIVSRLSSRVFLGKELGRDRAWLDIAESYTLNVFAASRELRAQPTLLRPFIHWFLPHCTMCRQQYRDAKKLISGEFDRRGEAAKKALAEGRKPPKKADAIGWMVEKSKGKKLDLVGCQLQLSMAAIHTTTETLTQAIMDLCENPEYVQPLREEAVRVVGEHGWAKTSMYQLKLMDSFMKESQRMHRPLTAMQRSVDAPLGLSDGTKIPKGSRIMVESRHFDPRIYAEPYKFDAYRFLVKREQPGQASNWQFVTTSSEFIGFGHGLHACPGRFFVSNELKIALCHLLLKYDFRLVPGQERKSSIRIESSVLFDPTTQFQLRRRKEEIDLSGSLIVS